VKFLTRKWRNDFKTSINIDLGYDLFEDWDLIESSFAKQYGIRIRKDIRGMEWGEFYAYLSGLNGDTPLGNIVRIRTEKDPKIIKQFTQSEKNIRSQWLKKTVKSVTPENEKDFYEGIKQAFISLSKKNKKAGEKK
jgi:hypothetical protein